MKLRTLLPFLDDADLSELAEKVMSGEVEGMKIVELYPFLDDETTDKLFEDLMKKGSTRDLVQILPFLSKEQIGTLYDKANKGEIKDFRIEVLIPFLGKGKIKDIFNSIVSKEQKNHSEE